MVFLPGSFGATAWRDNANRVEGSYEQKSMNTLTRFLPNGPQHPGLQPSPWVNEWPGEIRAKYRGAGPFRTSTLSQFNFA